MEILPLFLPWGWVTCFTIDLSHPLNCVIKNCIFFREAIYLNITLGFILSNTSSNIKLITPLMMHALNGIYLRDEANSRSPG